MRGCLTRAKMKLNLNFLHSTRAFVPTTTRSKTGTNPCKSISLCSLRLTEPQLSGQVKVSQGCPFPNGSDQDRQHRFRVMMEVSWSRQRPHQNSWMKIWCPFLRPDATETNTKASLCSEVVRYHTTPLRLWLGTTFIEKDCALWNRREIF